MTVTTIENRTIELSHADVVQAVIGILRAKDIHNVVPSDLRFRTTADHIVSVSITHSKQLGVAPNVEHQELSKFADNANNHNVLDGHLTSENVGLEHNV